MSTVTFTKNLSSIRMRGKIHSGSSEQMIILNEQYKSQKMKYRFKSTPPSSFPVFADLFTLKSPLF